MSDEDANLTDREKLMAQLLHFHTLTMTGKLTVVEARSRAGEEILASLICKLDTPPFPVSELPDRIRRATVRHADAILAEMADTSNSIASDVRRIIDASNFGPFPEYPEE